MFRQRSGQTLVEYGLLLALIAIIVIVAIFFLGPIISNIYANQQHEGSPAPSLEVEESEASPPQQIVVDGYTYELVESASPQPSDE